MNWVQKFLELFNGHIHLGNMGAPTGAALDATQKPQPMKEETHLSKDGKVTTE